MKRRTISLKLLAFTLGGVFVLGAAKTGQETGGQPITSLSRLLDQPNPARLAGQRVELSSVPVARVLNEQVLLVGVPNGPQLVVRSAQSLGRLKPGQLVDVTGIADQMPVTTQGWNLPGQESQFLRGKEVFINATSVRPHSAGSSAGH